MKRTPLRRRSRKRERLYATFRTPLVAALLADNPLCQRCHTAYATDVHEIKTRARGGSILDPDNLALLCRPCHSWITTHPAAGHDEGLMRHSWED